MARTASAETRFALCPWRRQTLCKHEWVNLRRERRLGLLGDRLERRRLVDGEIRQHLAVHRDARLGKAIDKPAIGHAERTHRGVEALDPQRAEGALLALAVTEGVLRGLLD